LAVKLLIERYKGRPEREQRLLDEGRYLGSVRTMYRLLARTGASRERRNQLVHPAYTKPELLAIAPNQVWSWDTTKLMGPRKWTYFYLYVIVDIVSRRIVGLCVADTESAIFFTPLFENAVDQHTTPPGQLTCMPTAARP
jgi:putative transposase